MFQHPDLLTREHQMPIKTVRFRGVRFDGETVKSAAAAFGRLTESLWRESMFGADMKSQHNKKLERSYTDSGAITVPEDLVAFYEAQIGVGDVQWQFDTPEEFFAELRKPFTDASVTISIRSKHRNARGEVFGWAYEWQISVEWFERETTVEVTMGGRSRVEEVMGIFEVAAPRMLIPVAELPPDPKPRLFIGHGHSKAWVDLSSHLRDLHGYEIVAFETGARAGHSVRDILDDMLDESAFAIIVMTAEDEQKQDEGDVNPKMRARQNVVHEAGLFQGRLGFSRAVILLENGTEPFSNLDGVQYIPFSHDNIRETFGDVLATLRREFQG
jgi:hypothetical protein